MLFFGNSLESVTEADLSQLIEDQVPESKTLDFKRDLPGSKSSNKRDYLKDVSAFANTSGGFIIYGMDEEDSVASDLVGLEDDRDEAIRRLNSLAESSIKPRVPGLNFHPISLKNGRYAVIASIPKSWNAPHVVDYDGHWRFYARNSNGNFPLDVGEIRSSIIASETLRERIRQFRMERLANIVAGETPAPLKPGPTFVLTSVPLSAFSTYEQISFNDVLQDHGVRHEIGQAGRYNVDGYVAFRASRNQYKYTQIFRNGIIEHVNARIPIQPDTALESSIWPHEFELLLIKMLMAYISICELSGTDAPILVSLSLLDCKGYQMYHPMQEFGLDQPIDEYKIDRDTIVLPEILVEDLSIDPDIILKPLIDMVWNASNWPNSPNY